MILRRDVGCSKEGERVRNGGRDMQWAKHGVRQRE